MKNSIKYFVMAIVGLLVTSCTQNLDGPDVTPPTWKGFNYVVRKGVEGGLPGEFAQIERGDLEPGDSIKVYAVRKHHGIHTGQISGSMFLRCIITPQSGPTVVKDIDKSITQLANAGYTGWEDPYATFELPEFDEPYTHLQVQVACQFYFKAFGNQNSKVSILDQTSNEAPYLGHIYTDFATFDPMNGGSASSGREGTGLKYHTLYPSK